MFSNNVELVHQLTYGLTVNVTPVVKELTKKRVYLDLVFLRFFRKEVVNPDSLVFGHSFLTVVIEIRVVKKVKV